MPGPAPGPGQGPGIGGPQISPALQRYLELTQEQVTRINRLNNAVRQFQAQKLRRSVQVQQELREEMRRETLDPMAIGLRQVELEAIRREIQAEESRTREQIQETFTPAQRNRIAALQEVLRQYPMACEALQHNLLAPPVANPPRMGDPIPAGQMGFATFLLGTVGPVCPGVPANVIRMGNFQPAP